MPLIESRSGNYVPSIVVIDSTTDKSTRTPLAITGRQLTNADSLDVTVVDESGDQITSFGSNFTLTGDGIKTVTTAGTDIALSTSTTCKKVVIQALTTNTNPVAIGASGVDATLGTGTGIILYAGDSIDIYDTDLANIFVDSITDGEGVRFLYYN